MRASASLWAFPLSKGNHGVLAPFQAIKGSLYNMSRLEMCSLKFANMADWCLTHIWESQSQLWIGVWLLLGKSRDQEKSWWAVLEAGLRSCIAASWVCTLNFQTWLAQMFPRNENLTQQGTRKKLEV